MKLLTMISLLLASLWIGGSAIATEAAAAVEAVEAEYVNLHGNPALPFSTAVRVGDTLYLAGDLGADSGKLVPGGIVPEAHQMFKNVTATLAHFGASLDNIVKCQVFLADMADWDAFNVVYASYFKPERFPARATFGATGLALGARVEMECIAWLGGSSD